MIFVLTTTDIPTDHFTPCTCERGNYRIFFSPTIGQQRLTSPPRQDSSYLLPQHRQLYHPNYHYPNFLLGGSRSLQNLVAVSQRYCQPVVTLKAGCIGNDSKNWLLNPGTSSQSEGCSSKWLIWLVCREPLLLCTHSWPRAIQSSLFAAQSGEKDPRPWTCGDVWDLQQRQSTPRPGPSSGTCLPPQYIHVDREIFIDGSHAVHSLSGEGAYWLIPVHPQDRLLLAVKWDSKILMLL